MNLEFDEVIILTFADDQLEAAAGGVFAGPTSGATPCPIHGCS
jgi:hypothetical protein